METDQYYHVYNRGNNRQKIFFEEKNYALFLKKVDKYLSPHIDMHSYCLMPNHFHLFFKVLRKAARYSLDKSMQYLLMSYAKSINTNYNRTGALFQPKYKSKLVDCDAYYSELIQYIHMNPVVAKLVSRPEEWSFSSYNAILSDLPTRVNRKAVLDWFGGKDRFLKLHGDRILDIEKLRAKCF